MRNYEDLTPEEQAEFKEEVEKQVFTPLEKRGIVKKTQYKGKNTFKTPVNPMKIMAVIAAAAQEKGNPSNSIIINGQVVFFSMSVVLTMCIFINEDGSEEQKKLDEYLNTFQKP